MGKCYKSYRIIDGKPRWVVEDEGGNIDKFRIDEKVYDFEYQSLISYIKSKKYFSMFETKNWLEGAI